MHTIQRKVVIYTTLRIVGYLLLWKYSCFIFGTENSNLIRQGQVQATQPGHKGHDYFSPTDLPDRLSRLTIKGSSIPTVYTTFLGITNTCN